MATPRLDGKVAIITGAAGGIGAAAAKAFLGEGALILLTDADAERVRHLAAELGDRAGPRAHDVTSEDFRRVLDVNSVGVFRGMQAIPMRRIGTPEEVAQGLYLVSDESAYMTGTELVLDGGTTA
jgi:NAD(P)-dependent dehydrogenase (short-subunit alcohol dehydrogenase family)